MIKTKELYLCKALDKFKEMIKNGECSRVDILYFYDLSKYELDRRDKSIDRNNWVTKQEAIKELNISRSTFDRLVLKGILPRGKKISHKKCLYWKYEQIEQLKLMMLLNINN